MRWVHVDIEQDGKRGVEFKFRVSDVGVLYVYINGSDHFRDFLEHVTPGARRREYRYACQIFQELRHAGALKKASHVKVGGHSWGGVLAVILANIIPVTTEVCVFGGKRTPRKYLKHVNIVAYRHRGDVVPFLPPWRPGYQNQVFGMRGPARIVHSPRFYHTYIRLEGF